MFVEKEELLARINNTDKRIDKRLALSEKTFNFACYAKYWFEKGGLKAKTQILSTLGSNLTIKDKKLCVDGQKPFYLIEKGMEEVKMVNEKFEPVKMIDLAIESPVFADVSSSWLSIGEEARTVCCCYSK
jgi:hypothetical protein